MKVKIKKTDKNVSTKKGEVYNARPYWLDPDKVVLLYKNGKEKCTEYLENVEVLETATLVERRKVKEELNRILGRMPLEVGLMKSILK